MGNVNQQLDNNQRPLQGLYVPGQTPLVLPAAGTVLSDTNNNGQQYSPTLMQLGDRTTPTQMAGVDQFGNVATALNNFGVPAVTQKANGASTGSVASLTATFTKPNIKGNSIIVVAGCGNGTAMTVADSAGNTYTQAVTEPNSTTFEAAIFYAVGIAAFNNNVVTVTNAGAAASMAVQIYEVSGLLTQVVAQPDYTSVGIGTSASPSIPNHAPSLPNSLAFLGVAVGTAAQAVSVVAGSGWTLDSTQNTTTPAGLFTFGALSQFLASTAAVTPKATLAGSEPWALAAAVFKPVALPVMGIVTQDGYNYTHVTTALTNSILKTGPGILHAIIINAAVGSGTLEFDDAITHTNAMGIITFPATLLQNQVYLEYDIRFNTGLALTTTGTMDATIVWK